MSVEGTLIAGSVWADVPRFGEPTPVLKPLVLVYLGTPVYNSALHTALSFSAQAVHFYPLAAGGIDEPLRTSKCGTPLVAIPLQAALAALRQDRRVRGGYYHTLPAAVAALERLLNGPESQRVHVAIYWS